MRLALNKSGEYIIHYFTPKGWRKVGTRTGDKKEAQKIVKASRIETIELMARAGHIARHAYDSILNAGQKSTVESLFPLWVKYMRSQSRSEITITNYSVTFNSWLKFSNVAKKCCHDITAEHISPYVNRQSKAKASTRDITLNIISTFFTWAKDAGYCNGNPAGLVKVDLSLLTVEQKESKVRIPFTDAELDKVYAIAPPFWKIAIWIARRTALRISDVVLMEWASVTANELIVWTRKTDKRHTFPMDDDMRQAFGSIVIDRHFASKYCFPTERSKYLQASSRSSISTDFTKLCRKAGVEGRQFHGIRHKVATELYVAGGIEAAQQVLGHSDPETSKGYVHV